MAKLKLERLTKDFGTGRPAVSDVSLEIREGGFLALLGPSGCGKTTVLRMIAGFEQPTDGAIHLGDRLLAGDGAMIPPERRNMAMVFQSYALWPHMSVADNVGYPLKVRGVSSERYRVKVAEALAAVRLEGYSSRRPSDLSGGQRQRVALARCLVTEPDVVLLDEPLANLDRHLQQEMEETFREFHRRSGATMVYVTHDQSEAMALASDIAVMSEGRLLQIASPDQIYARPEGRTVGSLIGQGSILSLPAVTDWNGRRELDWLALRNLVGCMPAPGIAVEDVLVRPQDVEIGSQEGAPAIIESIVYEGERYSVLLKLADGQTLRAFSRLSARPGETLRISIRAGWRL